MHCVCVVQVGEWSLAITDCMTWVNGVGLASGAVAGSVPDECEWVACPSTYNEHVHGTSSLGGPTIDGKCPVGPSADR